jgi:hypothetical protein
VTTFVVELDSGDREFFYSASDALRYAKKHEEQRRHSVEYLAVAKGESIDGEITVYRGQELRFMIRSLNNVRAWIRTGAHYEEE